jgi:hypothetical protein
VILAAFDRILWYVTWEMSNLRKHKPGTTISSGFGCVVHDMHALPPLTSRYEDEEAQHPAKPTCTSSIGFSYHPLAANTKIKFNARLHEFPVP